MLNRYRLFIIYLAIYLQKSFIYFYFQILIRWAYEFYDVQNGERSKLIAIKTSFSEQYYTIYYYAVVISSSISTYTANNVRSGQRLIVWASIPILLKNCPVVLTWKWVNCPIKRGYWIIPEFEERRM